MSCGADICYMTLCIDKDTKLSFQISSYREICGHFAKLRVCQEVGPLCDLAMCFAQQAPPCHPTEIWCLRCFIFSRPGFVCVPIWASTQWTLHELCNPIQVLQQCPHSAVVAPIEQPFSNLTIITNHLDLEMTFEELWSAVVHQREKMRFNQKGIVQLKLFLPSTTIT